MVILGFIVFFIELFWLVVYNSSGVCVFGGFFMGKRGKRRSVGEEVREASIARMAVEGVTYREIGDRFGISPSRVSEILNRDEVRRYIDRVTNRMISETLEKSYENVHYVVERYRSNEDDKEKEHGFRASLEVLRGAGVLPGAAQSLTIANITNSQTNILSPVVAELIKKHLGLDVPSCESLVSDDGEDEDD
ncbi:MAG TPA: helix-turn-helix domain-containing protein [Candidatus Syntrophosphaera sp.]|nr:helix-turn-helix domain-containing protein [Candidatus Syntrophosphaera sp.]